MGALVFVHVMSHITNSTAHYSLLYYEPAEMCKASLGIYMAPMLDQAHEPSAADWHHQVCANRIEPWHFLGLCGAWWLWVIQWQLDSVPLMQERAWGQGILTEYRSSRRWQSNGINSQFLGEQALTQNTEKYVHWDLRVFSYENKFQIIRLVQYWCVQEIRNLEDL